MGRLLAIIGICATSFILPWWMTPIIAGFLAFRYKYFYEAVGVALLMDSVTSVHEPYFFGFRFVISVLTVVAIVVAELLKSRMIFYR